MRSIIDAFNAAHGDRIWAELTIIPSGFEHSYEEKVQAAFLSDSLPDVLDLDGPFVARWAWAGILTPLDDWMTDEMQADFLPSILDQGTYDGHLYALGAFDSGLGLYYNADLFAREGIAAPRTLDEAWTWDEFFAVAQRLTTAGRRGVALRMDLLGEWYTYAFAPLIWSNDGRLLSEDGRHADGFVNGPPAVAAMTAWQRLFTAGIATATPAPDTFERGAAAMAWSGHWNMKPFSALDFRVGLMPLPYFKTPKTGMGSWCWGLTSGAADRAAAWEVLSWIVGPDTGIAPIVRANDAPPARISAYALFPAYDDLPRRLFKEQLVSGAAQPRPKSPAYPTLTAEFASALRDIALGSAVQPTLDRVAARVDAEIARHKGYATGP